MLLGKWKKFEEFVKENIFCVSSRIKIHLISKRSDCWSGYSLLMVRCECWVKPPSF